LRRTHEAFNAIDIGSVVDKFIRWIFVRMKKRGSLTAKEGSVDG
jgi:hypothetical protein